MPQLSKARLQNYQVTCSEHDLVFNSKGLCAHMPSQEILNRATGVHGSSIGFDASCTVAIDVSAVLDSARRPD